MVEILLSKVAEAARSAGVSDAATKAAVSLARDPHGIERTAAPSMIASSLDVPIEDANAAIVELLARKLIQGHENGSERLEIDLRRCGLTENEISTLRERRTAFTNHGAPHSDAAMESLARLFEQAQDEIYVALEVTSPAVFKHLKARAKAGRKTTFLMPKRQHVSDQRRTHYDETKASWIRFFRDEERAVKRNTKLRVTEVAFCDLYTSALSNESARFDIFFLDSRTTRDGDILEAKAGTSLYAMIRARYSDALVRSCPLWRVWWGSALLHWVQRLALPLLMLSVGVGLAVSGNPYAIVVSTIVLGLLVNVIYGNMGLERWYRRNLFKR